MSSKAPRKAKFPKPLEPIITRTKSAQQKKQLNKKQKTKKSQKPGKPKLTKIETKSPKSKKKSIESKDAPLKKLKEKTEEIIEQVEYYPNKLKRDLSNKKVILKPKHNFKVIASTNKRKLAVPKKGIKSNFKTAPISELSMQDMVRMMEESRSLSDEDFMEILTCPSPVWWEDPPDQSYYEGSLYTRSPEPQRIKTPENQVITISPEPPPKKKTKQTNKKKRKGTISNKTPEFITQDKKIVEQNVVKKDEKFVKKQLKLENILGNIKNKTQIQKDKKEEIKENVKKRKLSESTEGDISDLSFNEEILKNIETMVIPMEKIIEQDIIEIKDVNHKEIEKELLDETPHITKPEIKDKLSVKSSNIDTKKINNDDVISVDSFDNTSLNLIDDTESEDFSVEQDNINKLKNEIKSKISKNSKSVIPYKKVITDLTEYITVYKIIPEKAKAELNSENLAKTTENNNKTKLDTVSGKLNEFFKQCKSNKRLKKSDSPVPANPLTDVKNETTDEKENGKTELEERSLVKCDECVEKTVNGKTVLSCEKCELGPILPCELCDFRAETKELYKKHVSTCKEIERISWSNNLVLNQT